MVRCLPAECRTRVAKTGRGIRWRHAVTVLGMLVAGCGGGAEMDALRSEAISEMLRAIPSDSVFRLASGDTLHVSEATLEFYRERDWRAAWVGPEQLLDRGSAVHEAIGRSWEDGLPAERYRHDLVTALLDRIGARDDARLPDSLVVRHLADLDLLVTEGFNRLTLDLATGMLDPIEAGFDYWIAAKAPPGHAILGRVIAGESPRDLVAELRPSISRYEHMREALLAFHELESRGGWPGISADATLREGERGDVVTELRQRLVAGADAEEAALARAGEADSSLFDADLKRAVQRFQDRHALAPDGTLGTVTVRMLNRSVTEWIAELRLNLDRWRWLPNDLGDRYVLVNIAGFELEVVDQGRTIESMNVVVGQRDTATPIFADSIRFVVVNPYWNVPDGIMERTIRPAMALDPDYLAKHDMEIVDGRVRQRPGAQNSLGRYKFIFPNDFDVYLHDTPEGHLFARTERAFSSGCVRIERPRDFARMLLELQSHQDPDSLDEILVGGEELWIPLDRPLPIYLLYFTAWAFEDGTTRFHRDVYDHDEELVS